jgi:hypothetical protein
MSQYLLASHVYLCVTDDHAVLLDLKRDKYVGIGRGQMTALAQCVRGWPALGSPAPAPHNGATAPSSAFLSKMLASGMLTTDAARGKDARPVHLPRPETTMMALDLAAAGPDCFDARPQITFGHVLNFVRATLRARGALRWRHIASVVAKVRARKARRGASQRVDLAAARRHVAAFVHLRPLLFTTKDACLADSLALVNFLAAYGIFPNWVFGVQTGPFAAHCWVQEGDVVLNDTPDHVRRYTPILAV